MEELVEAGLDVLVQTMVAGVALCCPRREPTAERLGDHVGRRSRAAQVIRSL
jgi:hypothetical protein